jgi:hypothetical protein
MLDLLMVLIGMAIEAGVLYGVLKLKKKTLKGALAYLDGPAA